MTQSSIRLPIALFFGLFCCGVVRADYMDWSYHWSISPSPVLASGTGSVAQALSRSGLGAHRLLVAAATTTSSAMASDPDHFNKNFKLSLRLTDLATHQSGNLTFSGNISGTLSYNRAQLSESFRTNVEHLRLGNHMYWVTLPNYVRLMPPGSSAVPMLYASVLVQNLPPSPPLPPIHPLMRTAGITTASIATDPKVASTPEPSGIVLGSLGAVLGCVVVRRIWG